MWRLHANPTSDINFMTLANYLFCISVLAKGIFVVPISKGF